MTEEELKELCDALRNTHPSRPMSRQAADEIERLKKQVRELTRQIEHYHGKWGKPEKEVYDKVKGHAVMQSDAEPIEQARYHLQKADQALHDVEGDPYADEAHRLVHEVAFMITDEPELQALRKLPMQSDDEFGRGYQAGWKDREARDPLGANRTSLPPDAQSDAKPVAWRWKWPDSNGLWYATESKQHIEYMRERGCDIQPLYTAPPRPDDAEPVVPRPLGPDGKPLPGWYYDEYGVCRPYHPDASAGLLEAAEIAEKIADDDDEIEPWAVRFFLCSFAKFLRARAADRSGK